MYPPDRRWMRMSSRMWVCVCPSVSECLCGLRLVTSLYMSIGLTSYTDGHRSTVALPHATVPCDDVTWQII